MKAFRVKDPQAYHELSFNKSAGSWVSVARAAMEIVVEETVDVAAGEDEEKEKQEVRVQQVMAIMAWANRMAEGSWLFAWLTSTSGGRGEYFRQTT